MEELGRRVAADGTQLVVMAVPSRYRLMGDGRSPITGPDFHDTVRRFADRRIAPLAAEIDENDEFPTALFQEMAGLAISARRIRPSGAAPAPMR